MQDKEFDKLFNSRLDDFEAQPSAEVWQNINAELNHAKPKRSLAPYLSIAASIIILASVSVWWFNRTPQQAEKPKVKLVKQLKSTKPHTDGLTIEVPLTINKVKENKKAELIAVQRERLKSSPELNTRKSVKQIKEEIIVKNTPLAQNEEPVLASATIQKTSALQPELHNNEIQQNTGLAGNPSTKVDETKPDVTAAIQEKPAVKKRAGGLGGLINTIVAAVDKREDKLIEFTDDENDEGARLTAVNLGIFKIKKQ